MEQKKLLIALIVLVIVPIVAATLFYTLWLNLRKINSPTIPVIDNPKAGPQQAIPSGVSTQSDRTTDFQAVVNEDLDFEIKIPKEWAIPEKALDETPVVRYIAPDKSSFEVFIQNTTLNTLEEYLNKMDEENKTGWEGSPSKEVLETKESIIGKYQAVMRKERWLAADFTTVVTYIKVTNKIYTFTVIPNPDIKFENQDASINYELILSTFKVK